MFFILEKHLFVSLNIYFDFLNFSKSFSLSAKELTTFKPFHLTPHTVYPSFKRIFPTEENAPPEELLKTVSLFLCTPKNILFGVILFSLGLLNGQTFSHFLQETHFERSIFGNKKVSLFSAKDMQFVGQTSTQAPQPQHSDSVPDIKNIVFLPILLQFFVQNC